MGTRVCRIFERGPENLRILKIKRKVSLLRFSPVFGPKLGEDEKKTSLQSDSVRLCAQTLCQTYKKRGVGMPHFCILSFYANYTILAIQRGAWHHGPTPKYVPAHG